MPLMNGSWFVKRSRRKTKHLRDLLRVYFVDNFLLLQRLFVTLFFSSVWIFSSKQFRNNYMHCEVTGRYSMHFLLKYNWRKETWKVFFGSQSLGAQTDMLVSQTAWICHWLIILLHRRITYEQRYFVNCFYELWCIGRKRKGKHSLTNFMQLFSFYTPWKH